MFFNKNKKRTNQNGIKVNFLSDASSGSFQKDLHPSSDRRSKKKNTSGRSFWHAFKKINLKDKVNGEAREGGLGQEVSIRPKIESVKERPISINQKKETPTPPIGQLGDIKKAKKKEKKSFWSSLLGSPKKKDVKKEVPKIKKEPVKPIEQKKEVIALPLKRIEPPKTKLTEKKKKEKKSFWSSLLGSPKKKDVKKEVPKIDIQKSKELKNKVNAKGRQGGLGQEPVKPIEQKKEILVSPTKHVLNNQIRDFSVPEKVKKEKKSFWGNIFKKKKKDNKKPKTVEELKEEIKEEEKEIGRAHV